MSRILAAFSCGDASAVACRLALQKYSASHEVLVCRIVIKGEHEDNDRFAADFARWTGGTMTCPTCGDDKCETCNGTGEAPKSVT